MRCARDRISPVLLEVTQNVVSKLLQDKLLRNLLELPTSGHLGSRKTYDHLLRQVFWLDVLRHQVLYCNTCETCQALFDNDVIDIVTPCDCITEMILNLREKISA